MEQMQNSEFVRHGLICRIIMYFVLGNAKVLSLLMEDESSKNLNNAI